MDPDDFCGSLFGSCKVVVVVVELVELVLDVGPGEVILAVFINNAAVELTKLEPIPTVVGTTELMAVETVVV